VTLLLISLIVLGTVASDMLQSWDGRRQGGVQDAAGLGRHLQRWPIVLSIACMAVSFFSFIGALRYADMSYVVPASAASIAIEIALARIVLGEQLEAKRWVGAALVAGGVLLLAQS
jgi:uncharacterized membrane protein